MIRKAKMADFGACLKLAEDLKDDTVYKSFTIERKAAHGVYANCVMSQRGYASVVDDKGYVRGFLLGVIQEWPFGKGYIGSDLITLVEPGAPGGLSLIQDFIAWCLERPQVKLVLMGVSSGDGRPGLDRVYERAGLTKTGGMYALVIGE